MTATAAPRTVPRVPCSAEEEAREAHDAAHRAFWRHLHACHHCINLARLCWVGQQMLDEADDAGKRWEMAEAKSTRMAGVGS